MLKPEDLAEFNEKGFFVVKGLFSDDELKPVERDLLERIDELAGYLKVDLGGVSQSINDRMMALEKAHPGAALTLTHSNIIGDGLFNIWSSKKTLDIAESILGGDIDGHPFFAVRPKPPEIDLFVVPWHQDSSYLANGAQLSPQLTFWVPLVDATVDNGCMEMAVGQHRDGEKRHVAEEYEELGNSSWYLEIEPSTVNTFKTEICEMKRGDVILFTQLTPHRSLPNLSSSCRWSVDMRYIAAGYPAGTSQNAIPFRRSHAELDNHVETSKAEFQQAQKRKDRSVWRHRVERAVWKDRWN